MTVPNGVRKHVRIGDAMAHQLLIAGLNLSILPVTKETKLAMDVLGEALSVLDDLRKEVTEGEFLYIEEWASGDLPPSDRPPL